MWSKTFEGLSWPRIRSHHLWVLPRVGAKQQVPEYRCPRPVDVRAHGRQRKRSECFADPMSTREVMVPGEHILVISARFWLF